MDSRKERFIGLGYCSTMHRATTMLRYPGITGPITGALCSSVGFSVGKNYKIWHWQLPYCRYFDSGLISWEVLSWPIPRNISGPDINTNLWVHIVLPSFKWPNQSLPDQCNQTSIACDTWDRSVWNCTTSPVMQTAAYVAVPAPKKVRLHRNYMAPYGTLVSLVRHHNHAPITKLGGEKLLNPCRGGPQIAGLESVFQKSLVTAVTPVPTQQLTWSRDEVRELLF